MPGGMASSAVITSNNSSGSRKAHNRRESTGHVCTACDQCYRCKVRCSGERPVCERCRSQNSACTYSTGKPLGKPKGSKNKVQRSKSTSDVAPKHAIAPADIAIKPDWNQTSPTKRSNDGELPPPKRSNFEFSGPEVFPQLAVVSNIPDAATLAPVVLQCDPSSLTSEQVPGYTETGILDSKAPLDHRDGARVEEVFPSTELNLEIDDFDWFTLVGGTPAASAVELSTHDSVSISAIPAAPAVQPPSSTIISQTRPMESNVSAEKLDGSLQMLTQISFKPQMEVNGCLCDPLSLGIISELHNLQLSFSPLDTALILARRGLSTVSSYLSCPSCLSHLSNSPSLFLACVLILQQVFTCYLTVRLQGTKMLTETKDKEQGHSSVSIGEFEVEGEEGCSGVLDAIVKAEMEKGRGIIGGLENCVEKVGVPGKDRVAGVLLRALREEIGWGTAAG